MGRKLAAIAFGLLTVLMVVLYWPPSETSSPPATAAAVTDGADPSHRAAASPASVAAPVAPPPQRAPADATTVVTLRGRVRDDLGPIAGASVQWFAEPRAPDDAPAGSAITDAAGQFRGEARLGAERRFVAIATAEGHQETSVSRVAGTREVLIRMARWVTISGCVREHGSGAPIAGATVADQQHSAVTDARGRYTLQASIVFRAADLTASAPGFADQGGRVTTIAGTAEHDFALHRAFALTCIVVDRESAAPIANASIRHDQGSKTAHTGADGVFRAEFAPGRDTSFRVDATGYTSLRWTYQPPEATTTAFRLRLARGATITGRVRSESGQDIPGAVVHATNPAWDNGQNSLPRELLSQWDLPGVAWDLQPRTALTRSGVGGEFKLLVAAIDSPYVITADHEDWLEGTSKPTTVARGGDSAEVEVQLGRPGSLVGSITRGEHPLGIRRVRWQGKQGEAHGITHTEDDGSYRLKLPPGPVHVEVSETDGHRLGEATVTIVTGEETRWDLVLDEFAGAIQGRVTGPKGTPKAGISVHARAEERGLPSNFSTATDDQGRYVLRCPEAPGYTVTVVSGEFSDTRRGIAARATDVDFVVPEFGRLRMQLVDAITREPLRIEDGRDARVTWRPSTSADFQSARSWFDVRGRTELRLPCGQIDLSVSLPHAGIATHRVNNVLLSAAPQPAEVNVVVTRGVNWEVAVVGDPPFSRDARNGCLVFLLERAQLAMVRGPFAEHDMGSNHRVSGIHLWIEDPNLLAQLLAFDASGVAKPKGLAPGRYTLRAFPDKLAFEPSSVDIGVSDGRTEVRWRRR